MNVEGSVTLIETRGKKPPIVKTEKVFYLANFERRHDTLSMKTITENFSASRAGFKTPEELVKEVSALTSQQKNIYDDLYSLSYRKIPRPQPLNK